MKIGIISDTHSSFKNTRKAVEILNNHNLREVFHCGDWDSPQALDAFDGLNFPVQGVLGNCDSYLENYKEKLILSGKIYIQEGPLVLDLKGKQIAIAHGDNEFVLQELIESQKFDLVLTGHTHEARIDKRGKTRIVNPGPVLGYGGGPFRKKSIPTLAIYDFNKDKTKVVEIK
ncbi:MAG: YfcE family phosphodiesterase [Candidatus Moranbacteria bacterium]|nr:YfcE family phosphodiesterase [Candidatus Moranbacteria bacterium]